MNKFIVMAEISREKQLKVGDTLESFSSITDTKKYLKIKKIVRVFINKENKVFAECEGVEI